MKISTEIDSAANLVGDEKAVEYIAKAGFDAWDFSLFKMAKFNWSTRTFDESAAPSNYLAHARQLKQIGLDNGIICNQSHAPFPSFWPDKKSYLLRAIEYTAEAGGQICVIHPHATSPEDNALMYNDLLPFAKSCGIKIATENMFNWDTEKDESYFAACATPESFNAHLAAVNDKDFVACLDIGHAEMRGSNTSAVELIKALGSKLAALHIHDNDLRHDLHQIPFSMQINYTDIIKALKEINYKGYLTLEAGTFLSTYTAENVCEGITALNKAARKLAEMYENA
jgi:sugar phosphate isomerase/epimerase